MCSLLLSCIAGAWSVQWRLHAACTNASWLTHHEHLLHCCHIRQAVLVWLASEGHGLVLFQEGLQGPFVYFFVRAQRRP